MSNLGGRLQVLPDLAEIARQEGVRLSIEIDGPRGTVVIKDSRGGQTWVDSYRYLDAMTTEKHGSGSVLAGKLWASMCKSRGHVPRPVPGYLKRTPVSPTDESESTFALAERVEDTVEIGRRELKSLGWSLK
ncbi:hypothetical protein LCGC14_1379230 [marine sediment metagenome]|uniref:Uncharacterized protein n=1 Tax=marine sediment metagenome TaxID=412755 RepID=A0A0F9MII9_9ZZZZ